VIWLGLMGGVQLAAALAREKAYAYSHGTSVSMDQFRVAFSVPLYLGQSLFQAIPGVIMPVYIGLMAGGYHGAAHRFLARWLTVSTLVLLALVALIMVAAGPLVGALAPGFSAEQVSQTARWLRVLGPSALFMGIAGYTRARLDSHQRFTAPFLSSAMSSLTMAAACVIAGKDNEWGLLAGGLLGSVVVLLAQVGVLTRSRDRQAREDLVEPATPPKPIWKCLCDAAYLAAGTYLGVAQLNVAMFFASELPQGSISAFNYAWGISVVPGMLIAHPVNVVAFREFSLHAARREYAVFWRRLWLWMGLVSALFMAAGVVMWFGADLAARVLLGPDKAAAASMVAAFMRWLLPGILFAMIGPLTSQALIALQYNFYVLSWAAAKIVLSFIAMRMLLPVLGMPAIPIVLGGIFLLHIVVNLAVLRQALQRRGAAMPVEPGEAK